MPSDRDPRPRSIAEEWKAQEAHRKWIRYVTGQDKPDGLAPAPAYKDCQHCDLRPEMGPVVCNPCRYETGSRYESLPDGPPRRWYVALSLLKYAPATLDRWQAAGRISPTTLEDVATLRNLTSPRMF